METCDEPHPEHTSARTLLGQRAINAEHKQQHGGRVLRATFYTIQRRYASYCLVPSCLAGTQPESCTDTLWSCRLYLCLLWQAGLSHEPSESCACPAAAPSRSWPGSAAPRVPARFPGWAGLPEPQLTPALLGSAGSACCLAQDRARRGTEQGARCLPCLCHAWMLSRARQIPGRAGTC